MAEIKELKSVCDTVSRALKSMSSEELIVSRLDFGENTEGYRWELYRGTVPFWVDLMRFNGQLDLLVAYSIMFRIPESFDEKRERELYRFLLDLNDFSRSWDTKFFIKDRTVVLCAGRSGDEISERSAKYLVDSFSRMAQVLSMKVGEKFPGLLEFIVKEEEDK
ncbi:hypothetical protein DRQ36_04420 [bacterium]|nr:MAG: hypothetical protein DRQ36_04420 [bacterium]